MKDDLIGRLEKRASEWDAQVDGWIKQAEDAGQKVAPKTEQVMRDTIYRESKDEIERLQARLAAVEAERDAARDKALEEAAAVWPLVSETFAYQAEGYAGGWSAAVRAMKATIRTLKDQPHG